jgi:hypothetical protein
MRFRVFFEIKSLSAITAFELFFSLFHKNAFIFYSPALSRRALNVYRVPRTRFFRGGQPRSYRSCPSSLTSLL